MAEYHYRVTFVDTRGLKTSMGFLLGEEVYADAMDGAIAIEAALEPVSYTHLTLPTILLV